MCVAIIWCGRRTMHAVLLLPLGCIVIYITTDWVYHHTFNFTWKDVVPPKVLRTENRMMHYVAWMAWSPATKEAGMLIIFTYCRFFHAFRDSEFRWSMRDWWTWAMLSPFPARLRHPPSFQVENSAGTGYCPCRICLKSQTQIPGSSSAPLTWSDPWSWARGWLDAGWRGLIAHKQCAVEFS